jgi:RNA polymerase sigma factor (sigma-70 family)
MSEDSENGKNPPGGTHPAPKNPPQELPPFLSGVQPLVERLFAESNNFSWRLSRESFEAALERSARKQFSAGLPSRQKLEDYLGALHLNDLVLAASCAEGCPQAWEHFVATYRGYLRAAAGAILRCSAAEPAACELADSLFGDLYGLRDRKRRDLSLFRYFHGRSALKTWLRAILAQRHVDAIRSGRRFTELDGEDRSSREAVRAASPAGGLPLQIEPDPHRERYVGLFTRALTVAMGLLDQRDLQRLRLYYSQEQTLAEIGRALGEHESSVSRNLERVRRQLRQSVEEILRRGQIPDNGSAPEPGLSEQEIALCLQYASEDAPIDLDKLFQPSGKPGTKPVGPQP